MVETANLVTLVLVGILALERIMKQSKRCKSKCCCVEIDTQMNSPSNKKDYKDSVEEPQEVQLSQISVQPVP
jgi:hypothetical protein